MQISDLERIGENDTGFEFYVARLGKRWVGFALGASDDGERTAFFMSEVSEGVVLGMEEKAEAMRRTGLIAEAAYGGVDRWWIDEWLRPKPGEIEENVCPRCEGLYCDDIECFNAATDDFD